MYANITEVESRAVRIREQGGSMAVTKLTRPVRRRTEALVVTIRPVGREAIIEVREARRRQGFEVTLEVLYAMLARRTADRLIEQRRLARTVRRTVLGR